MKQPGWLMERKAVLFCGSSGGLLENHGNTGSSSPWPSCRFCWNHRSLCYFFFQVHFLVFFFGGGRETGEYSHCGGAGFVQEWFLHEFGQYQAESTGALLCFPPKKWRGPVGRFFFQVCFFVLFGDKKNLRLLGFFFRLMCFCFQANVFFQASVFFSGFWDFFFRLMGLDFIVKVIHPGLLSLFSFHHEKKHTQHITSEIWPYYPCPVGSW